MELDRSHIRNLLVPVRECLALALRSTHQGDDEYDAVVFDALKALEEILKELNRV